MGQGKNCKPTARTCLEPRRPASTVARVGRLNTTRPPRAPVFLQHHTPSLLMLRARAAPAGAVLLISIVCLCAAVGCDPAPTPTPPPVAGREAPAETVLVRLAVTVPEGLPADATVFLAGNLPALGAVWQPDAVPLRRDASGVWRASLSLPRGATLEYKFTLGSWPRVEKSADGADIANRTLRLDGDADVSVAVAAWGTGDPAGPRASTLSGDIRFHRSFASKHLNNRRNLAVYLPPGYDADADRRYPVLYMHDGQNVFDDATSFAGEWRADETAGRLIAEGAIRPLIIVAVDNAGTYRMAEYTPSVDPRWGIGGRADLYGKFLLEEVKPFIDETYRTLPGRDDTGVCGSSLGGLLSLHLARTRPEQVGLCAAVSPSLWWGEKDALHDIAKATAWTAACRVWFDMGTAEDSEDSSGKSVANTRELARIFDAAGRRAGVDYVYLEVEGGRHNEADWAARFEKVLRFLYPPRRPE